MFGGHFHVYNLVEVRHYLRQLGGSGLRQGSTFMVPFAVWGKIMWVDSSLTLQLGTSY